MRLGSRCAALLRWASRLGAERRWAVEDCRHLSRRLERDPMAAGEPIIRVPPKLMAPSRDSARSYGKSDPIDALAVAQWPVSTVPSARSDYWWTTANHLYLSEPD
jgi:transposase